MLAETVLSDLLRLVENDTAVTVDSTPLWESKARDIRRRMASVLGAEPETAPPLDVKIHEETRTEAYLRRLITYQTEPGERIPAYLLIPLDYLARQIRHEDWKNPGPAIVCLHQTIDIGKKEPVGLGGSKDYAYAHDLAERGYVCIVPDHLAAGDRVPDGYEPFETDEFYRTNPEWSAVGKAVWDTRRAVDVLYTLDEIDTDRIGIIGHSLGGSTAMFAAACDTRIRACVSNCGLTTFATNPNRIEWARKKWHVYIKALRPVFEAGGESPFDFHEVISLIAPRAFLNISSITDNIVSTPAAMFELAERVREVYGLLGVPQNFATHFHDLGHTFPQELRELAYGWFDRALAVER